MAKRDTARAEQDDPTYEQKMGAAKDALSKIGVTDMGEVERFLALFWSQVQLLPEPDITTPTPEKDTYIAFFGSLLHSSNPQFKARIDALNAEAKKLADEIAAEHGVLGPSS